MDQVYASLWMLVSAFLYSLQNVDARLSGNIFGFWTICFFRGMIGSFFSYFFVYSQIFSTNLKLLLIRSLLGGATIITLFFSIMKCGLSTTTVITSTSSIWTAWIGNRIMPEKYKWSVRDIGITFWCIGGIFIIGEFQTILPYTYYIGMICALLSAIFQSGVNITIKYLDKEPTMVVAFWGMMGSVLLDIPGVLYEMITMKKKQSSFLVFNKNSNSKIEMISLFTTGILSVLAQYCKTYSIQHSKKMSVLLIRYMDIVFSIIWDIFLFHEKKKWNTFVGMAIVLSGCLLKCGFDYYEKETVSLLPNYSTSGSNSIEILPPRDIRELTEGY